ncbi:hypothetical protein AMAG_07329 [Allomyces macrogynus ATCC 38327]|uniref:LAA1-like C-terminal TPR repeats domain-containing protein n=1 Tax=Allomyces macrogynus (strain ATCC 38327) TaxID=578462 RepID=A0A0L0SIB5_ALLM3|nr:hypothetical protein AMAG_07329 [Allomyces macrogynus ATCC 38327]|eukprot:KNE62075.1 hypothetical protein AMAG_07329 [Allomyces macrogynus ATCC 38327]
MQGFAVFGAAVGAPAADAVAPRRPASFAFDEQKIRSEPAAEKQELMVFQWLSRLAADLESAPESIIKAEQVQLECRLQLFTSPTLFPVRPTRAIRRLIAACYISLYVRGESRRAFDLLVSLQATLNSNFKNIKDETTVTAVRMLCVHVLGKLTERFGANFLSIFAETVHVLQKLLKSSSTDLNLRLEALDAFTRAVRGAPRGLTDVHLKECLKLFRAGLTDRCMAVRQGSADCISCLARHVGLGIQTVPDFEAFLHALLKGFEGSNYEARIAIARAIANVLAPAQTTFIPVAAPVKPTKKKGKKDKEPEEEAPAPNLEEKTLLTCEEMLSLLQTPFLRYHARESRVGVAEAYMALLQALGPGYVQANYEAIVAHLFGDVLSSPRYLTLPLPELVSIKELVIVILRRLGQSMSETAQLNAIKHLVERYLARWPAMPETPVPNKWVLGAVLAEMGDMFSDLSGVASTLPDSVLEALLKIVGHPSHAVQAAGAFCLMRMTLNSPALYTPAFNHVFNTLHKDLPSLSVAMAPDLFRKYIGYSQAVATLLTIVHRVPLHVPSGLSTHVFSLASNLLKTSSKDPKVSLTINEVAWNLISGLMTVGSATVKGHLSQCLLLWKDAFPKSQSSSGDLYELLHAKEGALKSVCTFLVHNQEILNPDIKKRLSVLIGNVVQLTLGHPSLASPNVAPIPATTKTFPIALTYAELDALFRKRLFDCIALLPPAQFDSYHSQLVKATGEVFAQDPADSRKFDVGPDYNVYHAFEKQAMPVNAPFGPLFWQCAEYGVTTLPLDVQSDLVGKHAAFRDPGFVQPAEGFFDYEKWAELERHVHHPIQGSLEYDLLALFHAADRRPRPSPPGFALINSAITLYGTLFPQILPATQEAFLENYVRILKQKQERPGRKTALLVNVLTALHVCSSTMLQTNAAAASGNNSNTSSMGGGNSSGGSQASQAASFSALAAKSILEIAQHGNTCADGAVRWVAAHVIGKVAELAAAGSAVASLSQYLVSQIVENRDPDTRAGGALALVMVHVYTHSSVNIKTTMGVLHTLCSDTHSGVAQWASLALSMLIEARSSDVYPYITPTLSVVCRQIMNELRPVFVGRIIYGCVETLGPELQVSDKLRDLICQFTEYLLDWEGLEECAEAWRTVSHILLMAPTTYPVPKYAMALQTLLSTDHTTMRRAVLRCLCQMIQRNPDLTLANTVDLEQSLIRLAQDEPVLVQKSLASLVENATQPSKWIDICRSLLNPAQAAQAGPGGPGGIGGGAPNSGSDTEDDSEELAVTAQKIERKQEQVKWSSQLTAIQSLRQVIHFLAMGKNKEYHVNMVLAKSQPGGDWLVCRLGDLIRVAFTASTALTQQVRAEGLGLLEDVLDHFSTTKDPDYEGHMLLEQYQAQFSSALTPAFQSDSYPEIVATASHVCARYIGSGITEELFTLSRIIKLLTQALDMIRRASSHQSQHATIMISLAVLSAWAELKRTSDQRRVLAEIVEPQLAVLAPMWLTCLFEYAVIKLDPDSHHLLPSKLESISPNVVYALNTRDIVLPMYHKCWISILAAVTSLLNSDAPGIQLSKHGAVESKYGAMQKHILVLLGLAFEPLVSLRTSETVTIQCIDALHALVVPRHIPTLHKTLIKELLTMVDRLLQTETQAVQVKALAFLDTLVDQYPHDLTPDLLYHVNRLLFGAIAPTMPHLLSDPSAAHIFGDNPADRLPTGTAALLTLGKLAAVHPASVPIALHVLAAAYESPLYATMAGRMTVLLKGALERVQDDQQDMVVSFVAALLVLVDAATNGGAGDIDVARNCLLASTVSLTSLHDKPFVPQLGARFTVVLVRCLEVNQLSLIAFQCAKSLIQLGKKPDARALVDQCLVTLVPHLIIFAHSPAHAQLANEWVATLILASVSTTDLRLTTLVLSALIGLLVRHSNAPAVKAPIVQGLLAIASVHTAAFKSMVAALPPASRQALEAGLRAHQQPDMAGAHAGAHAASMARPEKPSIQLKMSF